ncbi:MAG: esterase, partial [Burkholderiaceae bacterium]|nr:esterase [Burkholderiaceae bacterium]
MLIYLHGFRSSPSSFKARMIGERMTALGRAAEYASPALPVSPREAIDLVERTFGPGPADTLVGSSLGGCYATHLAERHGCRAVLLNPATRPAAGLARYLGPQTMFHDPSQAFELLPRHRAGRRARGGPAIPPPARDIRGAAPRAARHDRRAKGAADPG